MAAKIKDKFTVTGVMPEEMKWVEEEAAARNWPVSIFVRMIINERRSKKVSK